MGMPEAPAHDGRQATRTAPAANCFKKVRRLSIGRADRTHRQGCPGTNEQASIARHSGTGPQDPRDHGEESWCPGTILEQSFWGVLCRKELVRDTAFTSWETSD